MIKIPDYFAKQQGELTKKKITEARDKLDKFLKENEITIKPMMRYTPDAIFPDIAVVPNEFLNQEKQQKSGGKGSGTILKAS